MLASRSKDLPREQRFIANRGKERARDLPEGLRWEKPIPDTWDTLPHQGFQKITLKGEKKRTKGKTPVRERHENKSQRCKPRSGDPESIERKAFLTGTNH